MNDATARAFLETKAENVRLRAYISAMVELHGGRIVLDNETIEKHRDRDKQLMIVRVLNSKTTRIEIAPDPVPKVKLYQPMQRT